MNVGYLYCMRVKEKADWQFLLLENELSTLYVLHMYSEYLHFVKRETVYQLVFIDPNQLGLLDYFPYSYNVKQLISLS